jgi:hypothetical protein
LDVAIGDRGFNRVRIAFVFSIADWWGGSGILPCLSSSIITT